MKSSQRSDWASCCPNEFIRKLIQDIGREMQDIESLVTFIMHDDEAASTSLENLSRIMAVQEICELILRRKDRMNDILYRAADYAETTKS